MLSSTVPANSTGSWPTIPITECSHRALSIETSTPSSVTAPSSGSYACSKRRNTVLFPEPLAPTIAVTEPALAFRVRPRSTGRSGRVG